MTYPIPLQIHVIWHPSSDERCRPLASYIFQSLGRDPHKSLLPGIGLPVFFRSAGEDPGVPLSAPAPIRVSEECCDLRVFLLTSEFVLDEGWERYRAESLREVEAQRDKAAILPIFLEPNLAGGDTKAIVLNAPAAGLPELVLLHVLMQACRLLAGRTGDGGAEPQAAAPLRLFLSHTKRDQIGLKIAKALKKFLDDTTVDRFFDEVSIQPGDSISKELEKSIKDSALVAIRTDGYVSSPWCRLELALAKRERRPMVVVDALAEAEPRSTPFLANLASVRVAPNGIGKDKVERVITFIGIEVLRFLHAEKQLDMLTHSGIIEPGAVLLPRHPEARDLVAVRDEAGKEGEQVVVHPDPVLGREEIDDLAGFGATFKTPISMWSSRLTGFRLGISASFGFGPEEAALGLSPLHLEDAFRVIARQALAAGATLVYGGALNASTVETRDLTASLHEMIAAYNRTGAGSFAPLINYTPWPWHQEVTVPWLAERKDEMKVVALDAPAGIAAGFAAGDGPGHVGRLAATPRGSYALARSLTWMRERLTRETDARVVLGGKVEKFMGILPGVVEEAVLAIRQSQPLYVLGGFGGAARLVAQVLQGGQPAALSRDYQIARSPGYGAMLAVYEAELATDASLPAIDYDGLVSELATFGVKGLSAANGLSVEENLELFTVASIDAALYLIMKGLARVMERKTP